MGKYYPLEQHLNALGQQDKYEWNASFKQVEHILGFALPSSARTYPEWWANENLSYTSKSQCKAWAQAGWKTAHVNIMGETVTFISQAGKPRRPKSKTSPKQNLNIEYQWQNLGEIYLDHKDRLKFPDVSDIPAVYKLNIETENGPHYYVGETDNLRRRVQGYRTPGPTQPTNKRLQAIMMDALAEHKNVSIDLLHMSQKQAGQSAEFAFGLGNKFVRRLFENTAILKCLQDKDTLLNL